MIGGTAVLLGIRIPAVTASIFSCGYTASTFFRQACSFFLKSLSAVLSAKLLHELPVAHKLLLPFHRDRMGLYVAHPYRSSDNGEWFRATQSSNIDGHPRARQRFVKVLAEFAIQLCHRLPCPTSR